MDKLGYETPTADPRMVAELVEAIGEALNNTFIPDITTTADVLSALFTSLDYALRAAREDASAEDQAHNTKEINRVLLELLVEFGDVKTN
jgi:hypothetical protein